MTTIQGNVSSERGGDGRQASNSALPGNPVLSSNAYCLLPIACSGAALSLIFWGFFQLDRPFLEFMRSVHILWLERVGDLFYLIGTGGGLVTISIVLLAAGYLLHEQQLRRSGVESLIAHDAVALITQLMKHTIGRPRPRMMREQEFFTGPSLTSGLDSFPSGHASASFAVAAVVASRCPRWAWPAYALAGLIAGSRVVRGSHFATDVAAGIVLGLMVGSVVARPLREWRTSVTAVIIDSTPWLAVALAVLWTLCHPVADEGRDAMMLWTGSIAVAFGVGSRWGSAFRGEPSAFLHYATPAVGLGVAFTTGAWLIVGITCFVIATQWVAEAGSRMDPSFDGDRRALLVETARAGALVFLILTIQWFKGLLSPA